MKRRWVAAAALTIGLLAGGGTVAVANGGHDAVPGRDVLVSSAIVRFSGSGGAPVLHCNASHACAGVSGVDITAGGELRLHQTITNPHAYPILTVQCQADETLGGRRGIICGASGGTDTTRFWLYDTRLGRQLDLSDPADLRRVAGDNANLWISFIHLNGASS